MTKARTDRTKPRIDRETIALRVAKELPDGAVVNLGGGIPSLCTAFVPEGRKIVFQTETGAVGFGPVAFHEHEEDPYLHLPDGAPFMALPGMCMLNLIDTFAIMRGGHIDITVLGALQVSEKGDLANWSSLPGATYGNIGGGMDLAVGANKMIVAMEHTTKNGELRILKECIYPLTAPRCVNLIVTDVAVMEVTEAGLVLKEIAPGWMPEDVQAITEPRLIVSKDLVDIQL
jgi:3-oxoacid CoA-transferase B subunit